MKFAEYKSPCGRLLIGVHGSHVVLCDWITGDRIDRSLRRINKYLSSSVGSDAIELLDKAMIQLDEYFSGSRREFGIPILPLGTEFQLLVWGSLLLLPYGASVSYKDMAEMVGVKRGVRAVASAIGANPLSILIPCHRVVGSDGSLTGYAGGVDAKRYLLRHESIRLSQH